jgi:hypothetical protein
LLVQQFGRDSKFRARGFLRVSELARILLMRERGALRLAAEELNRRTGDDQRHHQLD